MCIFEKNKISYRERVNDWKEAVEICAKPLISDGFIYKSYVNGIFNAAYKLGPYFDFGKGIAVPHARPEEGVIKQGLSLLQLREPVNLLDDDRHSIDTFIILAAEDSEKHIELLTKLSEFLMDDKKIRKLKSAKNVDEIIKIFY